MREYRRMGELIEMREKAGIMEAIILSGGEGKRLLSLTKAIPSQTIPKALIKLNNKPIIEYQIDWLKSYGVENIVITANERHYSSISGYIGKETGSRINYSIEDKKLGTAGGVKNVLSKGLIDNEEFFVVNADDLTDINLHSLEKTGANAICLARMRSPYGVVHTKGRYVKRFEEKPLLEKWVNCGIYLLNKGIYKKLPDIGDLERDVFPFITLKHKRIDNALKFYKHRGRWHTINTQKDIEEIEKLMKKSIEGNG